MTEPEGDVGLLNIANWLTVGRIVLVPVVVIGLTAGGTGWRMVALAAFLVASLTDLLDGKLARSRGLVTDFGKIADPVADKALTGAALISLSALGDLPWWVTVVIMIRELGVTGLRFWVIRRGVIAASRGGKLKTLLQIVAICLYILPWTPGILRWLVMSAALVATVVTGVDYLLRALRLRRASTEGRLSWRLGRDRQRRRDGPPVSFPVRYTRCSRPATGPWRSPSR